MPVTQPISEMIAAARLLINQVGVHEAAELQRLDAAILIDLRDVRELQKMGVVLRAFHAPRSMLEFLADPDSPYHTRLPDRQEAGAVPCFRPPFGSGGPHPSRHGH